jgi:hypothetical protein
MHLLIYKSNAVGCQEFVSFWSQGYDAGCYPDQVYAENIGQLTSNAILKLFEWKNGSALSEAKRRTVQNFIDHVGDLRQLPRDWTALQFLDRFH